MINLKRINAGDTLVEVMIAMAVMGMVIAVSYKIAGRALQTAQQAEERGQAIKVSENQLERLKLLAPGYGTPATNIFNTSSAFCVSQTTNSPVNWAIGDYPPNDEFSDILSTTAPGKYKPECIQNGRFYFSVAYDASQNDLFTIRTRWDRIGGGRDEVKIVYHLHKK